VRIFVRVCVRLWCVLLYVYLLCVCEECGFYACVVC